MSIFDNIKTFFNKFKKEENHNIGQQWIFEKIDEEALKNQNKLKIWVRGSLYKDLTETEKKIESLGFEYKKEMKFNGTKYCTGSGINLEKIGLNIDSVKSIDWKKEINELLKNGWDGKDMSDSIKKFLSDKYGIGKSANELSSVNSEDLFNEGNKQKDFLKEHPLGFYVKSFITYDRNPNPFDYGDSPQYVVFEAYSDDKKTLLFGGEKFTDIKKSNTFKGFELFVDNPKDYFLSYSDDMQTLLFDNKLSFKVLKTKFGYELITNRERGYKDAFSEDAKTQLVDDDGEKIENYISFIEDNDKLIFKHTDSTKFPDQIISYNSKNNNEIIANSKSLTLSDDEIPEDKKELWNERNELLNKVKSLPSGIYKEGPDYDLINKTIAVINQDGLEEDEFYNYELFIKADNGNIVMYPDPYMVQLFITDTGEGTDISDEYIKCPEIPGISSIQNNGLTKEQFEYVNKYALGADYDALFEKQRKERPAEPGTFIKINSGEVSEKIRNRARNIKRRAVSLLEKEKDAGEFILKKFCKANGFDFKDVMDNLKI